MLTFSDFSDLLQQSGRRTVNSDTFIINDLKNEASGLVVESRYYDLWSAQGNDIKLSNLHQSQHTGLAIKEVILKDTETHPLDIFQSYLGRDLLLEEDL